MWYLNLYFVCETDKVRNFYMVIKSGTDFYVWSELWMAEDVRSGDVRSNMSEVTRNMKSQNWTHVPDLLRPCRFWFSFVSIGMLFYWLNNSM